MTSHSEAPIAGAVMTPIAAADPAPVVDYTAVHREHAALRQEATDLLSLAEHGWTLDRRMRGELVERLARLCDHLRQHFRTEEAGGYLHDVLVRRPGLQMRVATLQRQHGAFLVEGDVLAAALLGERPPRDWPARLVRLLEGLRRHEVAEVDLMQQAFLDDLGSGD